MGKIELDHTGSGGGVTLSSDGTDLLLDGTAIGGGGSALELYAENPSSPTAPSATGTNAVAIGSNANAFDTDSVSFGTNTAAGSRGVSIGPSAGLSSVSGATANVSIGWNAALNLTTGDENVAVGRSALQGNALTPLTGSDNVGVGFGAGSKVSSGNANAFVGLNAGNAVTSGSNNTFIGNNADGNANLSGQTGVGLNATTDGTNATALTNSYASGADAFAAAIANNTSSYGATGAGTIAIGRLCKATGQDSVAIGTAGLSSGLESIVIGDSDASGNWAIAIGDGTNASNSAAVAIGQGCQADALRSFAIGFRTDVNGITGKYAWSGASISGSNDGSSQEGRMVLTIATTDATPTTLTTFLTTPSATNQVILPNNSAYAFHGTIVARQQASAGTACAAWKIEGLIRREGSAGTTVLVNSATTVLDNTPAWGMALSADTTNGGLKIEVTGAASTNIRWVATINTSEVTY